MVIEGVRDCVLNLNACPAVPYLLLGDLRKHTVIPRPEASYDPLGVRRLDESMAWLEWKRLISQLGLAWAIQQAGD